MEEGVEYELVPISPIKKIQKELEEIRRSKISTLPLDEFKKDVEKLSEQIDKLITINLTLQTKITELLVKHAEVLKDLDEMVNLLRQATEIESESSVVNLAPVVDELKKIQEQNKEMMETIRELTTYLKRTYTRGLIERIVRA
ncbi:MAG: hypothetical protein QW507_01515 [Candidatus Nanoarchaeia archaeon]|nr:hypothetical protein [Candidatus Haiyanarchaeum thermophilum]MCW1303160.1 hypothetical protein [Candidatus Haiyanarchaeum thermophilum]MCW1303825.1 hypothetical protein [Candidatus Haiyanarchaeum thermophilum]MCW1306558.1 hypothetical protein [Candidatus Haiyanarchaeum thermophilum]MCW1306972.1 hypothetical protein [Candidatus Haiyanarchaeum thermophilum]